MMEKILSLELTTHCQQNCLHCFARNQGIDFVHMPYDRALGIMEEGRALGFPRLHLTGGEVLLYPRFFDVLEEARRMGFSSVFINTNGHLLDQEICERLAEREELEFSLSLNGPREFHDAIRGRGAYDLATAGLGQALRKKLKVHIFTVVSRGNLTILPAFCTELFEAHPSLTDQTFIQLRSGPEGEADKLTPQDYLAFVRTVALLGLAGLPVHILENPLSTAAALKMGFRHLPPSPPISREGKILVMADGRISDNHSSQKDLGRYEPGCLKDLLAGDAYASCWRERDDLCGGCPFFGHCRENQLLKPSDPDHNTAPYDRPFCRKVLETL